MLTRAFYTRWQRARQRKCTCPKCLRLQLAPDFHRREWRGPISFILREGEMKRLNSPNRSENGEYNKPLKSGSQVSSALLPVSLFVFCHASHIAPEADCPWAVELNRKCHSHNLGSISMWCPRTSLKLGRFRYLLKREKGTAHVLSETMMKLFAWSELCHMSICNSSRQYHP